MSRKITFIIICFIILFTSSFNTSYALDDENSVADENPVKAKILALSNNNINQKESENKQSIKIKILEGKYKNKITTIERDLIDYSPSSFPLEIGDTILVQISQKNGHLDGILVNVWRIDQLKILVLIFLVSLIIFGRLKGILSLAGLGFAGFIIIKFLIPYLLKGYNIMLLTIVSIVLICVVSFILISGFTKKTMIAILSTLGGTLISGILAYIFIDKARITGYEDEEIMFMIANLGIQINYTWMYICSIIIGCIGVVMDVSMSITSSIFEIKKQSPNIDFINLFKSGLKIGKDVMSTMVNTLVLAYVGSSMPLLIIYISLNSNFTLTVNIETITIEIIRSLCGSIGIILTIPITCFLAAHNVTKRSLSNRHSLK